MRKALAVINDLKKKGIIDNYAIGGGMAAIYYIEPVLTYDLDIFVILPETPDKKIIDLRDLFDVLTKKGYTWHKEHIIVEGVPVQFIPADALENEAINNALDINYEGTPTRVFSAEYLIAILVRAGRAKDIEKVGIILKQTTVNHKKLESILIQYDLLSAYRREFLPHEEE